MSARWSRSVSPIACSGAMYVGVPSATPTVVSLSSRRRAHRLGHAEVGDRGVAAREHHVVGLDVAMHHAALVGVGERVDHLAQDPDRLVHRECAFAREPLAQRLALHERHDVVEEAVGLAGVETAAGCGGAAAGPRSRSRARTGRGRARAASSGRSTLTATCGGASGPRRGRPWPCPPAPTSRSRRYRSARAVLSLVIWSAMAASYRWKDPSASRRFAAGFPS